MRCVSAAAVEMRRAAARRVAEMAGREMERARQRARLPVQHQVGRMVGVVLLRVEMALVGRMVRVAEMEELQDEARQAVEKLDVGHA